MIPALTCLLLPIFANCSSYVRNVPPIADVVAREAYYDGKTITVTGRVVRLDQWTSKSTGQSEVFSICQEQCVRVYMRAHSPIHNGELVTVSGEYYRAYRVGRRTYYNEIEGAEVLPRE